MDAQGASDQLIASVAERQHGLVAFRQLLVAGVSRTAIRRRTESGHMHRVHRGVYAVGHPAISREGRWMAAVLAAGGGPSSASGILERWGAAISHRSAAELWGLLEAGQGPVHVSVAGDGGKRRRKGVRLHRSPSLLPAHVTLRSGIPVTTAARTISDLQRAASSGRGGVSQRELRRAIRQANVIGLPIGEENRRDRTRSDLEGDFLRLCRRCRLPQPEVNVRIGRVLVDFLWRESRLVVETDSYVYHRGRTAFEDDHERDLRLRVAGYDVVRISEKQVDEEPSRVAEVVRAALRVGADGREREDRGERREKRR